MAWWAADRDEPTIMRNRTLRSLARAVLTFLVIAGWLYALVFGHMLLHMADTGDPKGPLAVLWDTFYCVAVMTALTCVAIAVLPFAPNPNIRGIIAIACWVTLLVLTHSYSHGELDSLGYLFRDARDALGQAGLVVFVLIYALALAIPFFPGVEIGLAIMAMFGKAGAIASYVATVLGLGFAFWFGWVIPPPGRNAILSFFGLRPTPDSVPETGEDHFRGVLPSRAEANLVKYRYLFLAALLNFPGNTAIGGGGGISFASGFSRYFRPGWFLLTISLAVAPVPILVLIGAIDMDALMNYRGSIHDLLTALEPVFGLQTKS